MVITQPTFSVDDDPVANVTTTTELPTTHVSTTTSSSTTRRQTTTAATTEASKPGGGEEPVTKIFAQVYDAAKQKYELLIVDKGSSEATENVAEETEVITDMVYHEEKACLYLMKGSPLNGTKITKRCEGSPKKWEETVIATHAVGRG